MQTAAAETDPSRLAAPPARTSASAAPSPRATRSTGGMRDSVRLGASTAEAARASRGSWPSPAHVLRVLAVAATGALAPGAAAAGAGRRLTDAADEAGSGLSARDCTALAERICTVYGPAVRDARTSFSASRCTPAASADAKRGVAAFTAYQHRLDRYVNECHTYSREIPGPRILPDGRALVPEGPDRPAVLNATRRADDVEGLAYVRLGEDAARPAAAGTDAGSLPDRVRTAYEAQDAWLSAELSGAGVDPKAALVARCETAGATPPGGNRKLLARAAEAIR